MKTVLAVVFTALVPLAQAQELLYTLVSPNAEYFGDFGASVSGISDVDGDGKGDILVGAPSEGDDWLGRAYVFSGASGGLIYEIPGIISDLGFSVSGVGDLDGDGVGDMVVGAPGYFYAGSGSVQVLSGATGEEIYTLVSPNPQQEGGFGNEVSDISDVNGDRLEDILVAAPGENVNGEEGSGMAYVFSGYDGELIYEIAPNDPGYYDYFGISVAAADDVDGDGWEMLL